MSYIVTWVNDGIDRTVREALNEFRYLIQTLSLFTQRSYLARMEHFTCWCEAQTLLLGEIKPIHVAMYLETLKSGSKKNLSSYTLHGYMQVIRTFLFWCSQPTQGYVWVEVPRALVMPRVEKTIIKPFTTDQVKLLQRSIATNHFPDIVARDKAILAVLLDTGIRATELCSLTLRQVFLNEKEAYLLIHGKGLRQREVPLGKQSRNLLEIYLQQHRSVSAKTDYVFLTHREEPMSVNSLGLAFDRWHSRTKITGVRCSPHDCRHTYAINYLMQGGDLYMLSRLMGHASVSTTEIYLRAMKAIQARTQSKSVLDHLFEEDITGEATEQKGEILMVDGRSIEETDVAYKQWIAFFSAWQTHFGNLWMLVSSVLECVLDNLPDGIKQGEQPNSRRLVLKLGTALRHRSDALYGCFSVRWKPGPRGMNAWQVYQVEEK